MRGLIPDNQGWWVLIDKPAGWTSFNVVAKIRGITKIKKVGHAGSLDPAATGLLVLALGKTTKKLAADLSSGKTYLAEVQLGVASQTWDLDTEDQLRVEIPSFSSNRIRECLEILENQDMQVPPMTAALKRQGSTLYKMAKRGLWIVREPRSCSIDKITFMGYCEERNLVKFEVSGGGGLYVRSIANDLGKLLNVPAALSSLRRTRAGRFSIQNATTIEELDAFWRKLKDAGSPVIPG